MAQSQLTSVYSKANNLNDLRESVVLTEDEPWYQASLIMGSTISSEFGTKGELRHGSFMEHDHSIINSAQIVEFSSASNSVLNTPDVYSQEGVLCRDYSCCGQHLDDLHALVAHVEKVHGVDPSQSLVQHWDQRPLLKDQIHHLHHESLPANPRSRELHKISGDHPSSVPPLLLYLVPQGLVSQPSCHRSSLAACSTPTPNTSNFKSTLVDYYSATADHPDATASQPLQPDYASQNLFTSCSVSSEFTTPTSFSSWCPPIWSRLANFGDAKSPDQSATASGSQASEGNVLIMSSSQEDQQSGGPSSLLLASHEQRMQGAVMETEMNVNVAPSAKEASAKLSSSSFTAPSNSSPSTSHTDLSPSSPLLPCFSPKESSTAPIFLKPFQCPKPDCDKSYKQQNGLRYHLKFGRCVSRSAKNLEQALSWVKRARRKREHAEDDARLRQSRCSRGRPNASDGKAVPASGTTSKSPSSSSQSHVDILPARLHASLTSSSISHLSASELLALSDSDLRGAEEAIATTLRPFACGASGCQRRYKAISGLKHHFDHTGDHGKEAERLWAIEHKDYGKHKLQWRVTGAERDLGWN